MDMYTPIEKAGDLIRTRWADVKLRKAVEEKLQGDIPGILKDGPFGMIWRHIGTPDGEFERFLDLCKKARLKPVCLEYIEDKFAARNFTKLGLTKLAFKKGINKKTETLVEKEKIIDFKDAEKKKMCELKTLWGESLVDFHHSFMKEMFPEMEGRVVDISDWVKRNGKTPKNYYSHILSLAICHVVLFDDLDIIKSETDFVKEIILPAFESVKKDFGVEPIIVKISKQGEQEQDHYWCGYSPRAKEIVNKHIKTYK